MKHRRLLAMICLLLTFALCSAAMADEKSDPFVVRVGSVGYALSEVQGYWDALAASYLAAGETIDSTQYDWYEQSVIDSYVKMGILQNKLIEYGLDAITAADQEQLEIDAQLRYDEELEQYAKQIVQEYGKTIEQAREYAKTFMELDGMTMEQARSLSLTALKEKRILDYATSDAAEPTAEEVEAFYREKLVEPSRENYEYDISAFEQDVLYYGAISYFIPSGYRYVRHILLPASEGALARANAQESAVLEAEKTVQAAENALYGVRLLEEDETSAALTLKDAQEALAGEQAKLQAIYDECMERYAAEIKDIEDCLAAGESFDSVSESYEKDAAMPAEGYLVCADSVLWAKNFREGAMALQSIGDVSQPICTNAGVHFLQYVADAPDGAVPLEGELLAKVKDAAYLQKRYDLLEGFIEQWRAEYEITTNVGLLSVPECLR